MNTEFTKDSQSNLSKFKPFALKHNYFSLKYAELIDD